MIVAFTTTLLFVSNSHAVANTNKTINFEGRLLTAAGAVVPDGNYNVQFKIYQDGTGTAAGNPNGSLKWTETYKNGNGTGVEVKNGFLSVSLGSVNPFGTSVDWDADTLWLSMNVAGTAAGCSTFGTAPCAADGEMLPMKRITATPYALNAGALNGKTADNFVQLGQGVQGDPTSNSSIFINKTAGGNLVQLQNSAVDVFAIGNTGNITLGSNADKSIAVSVASADTTGSALAILAGGGGSGVGSSGGDLVLQGGAAGGINGNGGNVQIDAGANTGTGSVGSVRIGTNNASDIIIGSTSNAVNQTISLGANNTAGSTTNIIIGVGGTATAGTTAIQSKDDTTVSTNGTQKARFSSTSDTLYVGNADSDGQATVANAFTIQGTSSTGSDIQGGSLNVKAGSATNGNANGGNITLAGGAGSGTGATGLVVIGTPTFQTAGQQDFAANGSVAQSDIDGNGVVTLNAAATDLTVTLGDPTIRTAGRIVYVTVPTGSEDFTLALNGGGAGNELAAKALTTTPLLWNGSDWTLIGGANSATLQDAYNNTATAGQTGITVGTKGGSGFALQNSTLTPVEGSLFNVSDASANTLFSVNNSSTLGSNIQIGSGTGTGTPTLLTLDKAASAPTVDASLVGSMYYDTTLGQVQCYEATGWGACSASPDTFVTLSPEYSNAVTHGVGIGTLTSDICSDGLNINDGSDSSPAICGTNETHNYYKWTTDETTTQNKSIYVTYKLPGNFKNFVAGSTSLTSLDEDDSSVNYQIYKSNASGLVACSATVTTPIIIGHAWQAGVAGTTGTDPSTCNFAAGDSVVFKINLAAKDNASAYASDLSFAFSNH